MAAGGSGFLGTVWLFYSEVVAQILKGSGLPRVTRAAQAVKAVVNVTRRWVLLQMSVSVFDG